MGKMACNQIINDAPFVCLSEACVLRIISPALLWAFEKLFTRMLRYSFGSFIPSQTGKQKILLEKTTFAMKKFSGNEDVAVA